MCWEIIYPVYNLEAKDSAITLKSALIMMFKFGIDYDNGPECFDNTKVFDIQSDPIWNIILKHQKITVQRFLKCCKKLPEVSSWFW